MNVHRLPSGSYRVTVQFAGIRRRATAPTERAARRLGVRMLAELEAANPQTARRRPGVAGTTVAQLVELHLAQADYAATTLADMTSVSARIPPWFATMAVTDVGGHDLDRLYTELTRAGWSAHRVHRVHELVSAALARAVRWQWIAANPARNARPPTPARREVRPPDLPTLARIMDAVADDIQFAAFVRLASVTGARRGELCGLQWGDVDLDAGTVAVRRAVAYTSASGVVIKDVKTGDKGRRVVPIGAPTVAALRRLRTVEAERLLSVGLTITASSWVFSDRLGVTPWRPDRPTQRWVRLRDRLGFDARLHDLRHLVATELLAAGVNHVVVAERLGHASPRTTLGIYGHSRPEQARAAGDLIDERLG